MELKIISQEELMEVEELTELLETESTAIGDDQADKLIRVYKAIEAEKERFEALATRKKQEIDDRLKSKTDKYNSELQSIALTLQSFAENQKLKETKTQKKYQLLSGDIIIKKPVKQIVHDKELLLKAIAETEYKEFKRIKEEVAWSDLKKRLTLLDDDTIVDSETGEVVSLEGLAVEEKPGTISIK